MNFPSNIAVSAVQSVVLPAIDRDAWNVTSLNPISAGRVGVLVLGMHRSGTSALAGMLSMLGCSLPATDMGANSSNPTGHWESAEGMVFNDELLALAGTSWDDWLPVGEGFFSAPAYPELVARGAALLRSEFGAAPLFVFKDPRNCRLGRFWLDVFAAEAISPAVVIPIRNPLEVARSLTARDQIDEQYGPLLWLRHVLDAEAVSRGRARVFTSYDQLIACWEAVAGRLQQELGIAWPRMSTATQEEIGAFIDAGRHHERASPEAVLNNPLVSGWVRRVFGILNDWATNGENGQDHAELDAIARGFADAAPAFARLIRHGTQALHGLRQLEAQVAPLRAAAARTGELETALGQATAARAGDLEAALRQADIRVAQIEAGLHQQLASQNDLLSQNTAKSLGEREALQSRIDQLTGWHDAAQAHTARATARISQLESRLGEARAKAIPANKQLREARDRLAEHGEQIADQIKRLTEQESRLAKQASGLAEQASRLAEQDNRLAQQESALAQRREENEQAWAEGAQQQSASARLRELLAASTQREAIQRQRLAEANAGLIRLTGERQAAQDEAASTRVAAEKATAAIQAEAERHAQDMASRLSDALASKAEIEARLAQGFEEFARMTVLLDRAEREAEAAGAQAQEARVALDEQEKLAYTIQARSAQLERELAQAQQGRAGADSARQDLTAAQVERFNELAVLTGLLRDRERTADEQNGHIEWLRSIQLALATTPAWWALLPRAWRRQRELGVLERKQLFDGQAYLGRYADVAVAGIDPLRHYLGHGMSEGRLRGNSQWA